MSATAKQDGGWVAVSLPEGFIKQWRKEIARDVDPPLAYGKGELRALVGREPVVKDDWRWHISISCPDRVPSWREMSSAVHELRPGVVFVIGIPPKSWWTNLHPHTLHAWEVQDPHLVEEWRRNARGDKPS